MLFEPLLEFERMVNRPLGLSGVRGAFIPAADVVVTGDEVTVFMDVPGLTADTLQIELENEVLTVRGERAYPYAGANGNGNGERSWQRIERGFGRFERSLQVPRGLDPDTVEASLTDGVLAIRIPKPEALKPHRVEIGTGAARQLEASPA
jgi:HSP20 family protein